MNEDDKAQRGETMVTHSEEGTPVVDQDGKPVFGWTSHVQSTHDTIGALGGPLTISPDVGVFTVNTDHMRRRDALRKALSLFLFGHEAGTTSAIREAIDERTMSPKRREMLEEMAGLL